MDQWFPVGKEGANTTYIEKESCELAEGQECFDITDKDLRYWVVLEGVFYEDSVLKAAALAEDEAAAAAAAAATAQKQTWIDELRNSGDPNIVKLLDVLDL